MKVGALLSVLCEQSAQKNLVPPHSSRVHEFYRLDMQKRAEVMSSLCLKSEILQEG